MKTKLNARYAHLDLLKIIACFLVIVNHTNSVIFLNSPMSPTWIASISYFFVSKLAVPLFIMCSGAVLLNKQDDIKKSLSRILKIVLVILIFSFFYFFVRRPEFTLETLEKFFKAVYQRNITNAFWYLYLYLGVLIMLPILQKLTSVMKKKDYFYFIFISIGFLGLMPILISFFPDLQYSSYLDLSFFSSTIGLLFAGNFIQQNFVYKKKYLIIAIVVFLTSILTSIFATYYMYTQDSSNFLIFDNGAFLTINAPAIALFYIAKCFVKNKSSIISFIGRCTFGIYLLSDFLISVLDVRLDNINFLASLHPLISVVVLQISVFIIGLAISAILQKIPFVKKLIS